MRIKNTNLGDLTCEKVLANHAPEYLPKGNEKGPMQVMIVEEEPKPRTRK